MSKGNKGINERKVMSVQCSGVSAIFDIGIELNGSTRYCMWLWPWHEFIYALLE